MPNWFQCVFSVHLQQLLQKNSHLTIVQKPQSVQQQQQLLQQQWQLGISQQQQPQEQRREQQNQSTIQLQQLPQLTSVPGASIVSGLTVLPLTAGAGVIQKNHDGKAVQPSFLLVQPAAVCGSKSGDLEHALTKSTPLLIINPSSIQPQLFLQSGQVGNFLSWTFALAKC